MSFFELEEKMEGDFPAIWTSAATAVPLASFEALHCIVLDLDAQRSVLQYLVNSVEPKYMN